MGFKVTVEKVNTRNVTQAVKKVITSKRLGLFVANSARHKMNQYVPKLNSPLRDSAVTSPFTVTYTAEYAVYQFYGKYKNYTTPGTGSRWDKKLNKGDLAREISNYINRGLA